MSKIKILWIDDEIDLLQVHIMLLEAKGYEVLTANNAKDGYDLITENNFDIVFIDENMPGLSGTEILPRIKQFNSGLPVIMVTKREEEEIMDEAIGLKIDGFLIKPVNPNQILLAIKQNVQNKAIIGEKTIQKYRTEFQALTQKINFANSFEEWVEIYKMIVFWDIELEKAGQNQMSDILLEQKEQANNNFYKFIENNYVNWLSDSNIRPPMIQDVMRQKIMPMIDNGNKIFLILIDNLRYDQWEILKQYFTGYFSVVNEDIISTILPTTTQYARNAFFSGLMPLDIARRYPNYWSFEEEEGNKNDFEFQLVKELFKRNRRDVKITYHKILNDEFAYSKLKNIKSMKDNDLNVFVFNFVDMLSHAKTNMQMVKDLAKDEKAYRALVKVWFEHSYIKYLLEEIAKLDVTIVLTTDHGSVQVKNPVKVIGDKYSSTNIRYKQGKNLDYNPKTVLAFNNPVDLGLPQSNISSSFIFSYSFDYLVYPKNYNQFAKYYKNTFQHGGISLEEMLVPMITMVSK